MWASVGVGRILLDSRDILVSDWLFGGEVVVVVLAGRRMEGAAVVLAPTAPELTIGEVTMCGYESSQLELCYFSCLRLEELLLYYIEIFY